MTAGSPPPGYPSPPNAPPPPPVWTPPPPSHSRGVSIPLEMLGTWAFIIGFLLVFVGAVVVVGWVSTPGSCATSTTCDANHMSGVLNAIWAAKILWVLGFSGIAAGAGVKLHWGPSVPRGSSMEEYTWAIAERRRYLLLFLVAIALLTIVVLTVNVLPNPGP